MGELVPIDVRRTARTPTRVQIYAHLREAIVRGDLEPGRPISENDLSAQLKVSRTPIREALGRLRDDRLVEILPQRGTFVSRINPRAVGDAQFIREALETAAIRRAAEVAGERDIADMETNLNAQDRANEAHDLDSFYILDDGFHRALCDLSGHPTVWAVSDRAKAHLNRVRRLSLDAPDYLTEMIEEHRGVLAAVAEHDADLAEDLLRHHLRMVLREVPRLRTEHPDYFENGA